MFISEGENQREFKLVPDGSHLAICYGIVDLGTQGYVYMNEKKSAKQLRLLWELHGEDQDGNALSLDDGRPLSISQRYTQSLGVMSQCTMAKVCHHHLTFIEPIVNLLVIFWVSSPFL